MIIHDKRARGQIPGRLAGKPGRWPSRIYVHAGEPKTGTTFLQDVLWGNRRLLAARGIVLPGFTPRDHIRARRDLRDEPRQALDLADPWAGEWDVLAAEALRAPVAVISDELLAACTERQIERAVRSLAPAELHVVLTIRALDAVLPAEWQETVKCGRSLGWEAWLHEVATTASVPDRRDRSAFWAAHDTLAYLQLWSRHLPADRLHVITTPRQRSPQLLWARLASVLDIDPAGVDLSQARSNSSLGYAETEFLRRVNELVMADVPDWFYTRNVKSILAQDVLRGRSADRHPPLPSELLAWAAEEAERVSAGLRDVGVQVTGDVTELLADRNTSRPARPARPARLAADPAEMVDAAVASAAALAGRLYQHMYPTRLPRQPVGGPRIMLSQLEWRLLRARFLERRLRRASHLRSVRRLRVAIWCVLMRPGRTAAEVPVLQPGVIGVGSAQNAA